MKAITVLFLILLPILLSAEYEPKVIVKHPFEVERDSIDPVADTLIILKDSLSRGTFLKMTIYDALGHYAVDSGYASDSGTAHLSYDNWNDGSPIDTADMDSVKIELPNAYRFQETLGEGEPEPVEYYFGTSPPLRGTPKELTDKGTLQIKLSFLDVQDNVKSIGEGTTYSFNFTIMADVHIGHGAPDFEEAGYLAEWQGTNGYEERVINHVKINRAVTSYIRYWNQLYDFKFLLVLGDISESAERAELECARDLLDNCARNPESGNIDIPYIPIFGNHDTWSYVEGEEEPHYIYPCGNSFREYGFGDYYETLRTLPPFGNWSEGPYLNNPVQISAFNSDSYFFNFSFNYQNYHFLCCDFNTRRVATRGGGTNPGTTIYTDADHTGNTWNWFWQDFEIARSEGREIVIIEHHPLDRKASDFGDYVENFNDELNNNGADYFKYWFGGHKHAEYHLFLTSEDDETDIICRNVISVGNSYDGWCKTVRVRDPYFLDLYCRLDNSGESYVFEGRINHSPGSSDEYYFHLLNEDEMLEGSGAINEAYEYTSTGTKTVTLDAVIDGSHYTITKAFEIPYVNYLVLQNETVSTTETYKATNYIDAGTDFRITSSGKVTMKAGNYILLLPGFEAQSGCEFEALIDESLKDNIPLLSSMTTENPSLSIPETKRLEEKPTKTSAELSSKDTKKDIPKVVSCAQNSPNPFTTSTTIKYGLPKDVDVQLDVYNLLGQKVRTLVNAKQTAGYKQVSWDGRTSDGRTAPKGVYFYTFKAGDYIKHHKMILVK